MSPSGSIKKIFHKFLDFLLYFLLSFFLHTFDVYNITYKPAKMAAVLGLLNMTFNLVS